MEAVRATLEAYAAGKIKLGKIPVKTQKSLICSAPSVIACEGNEGLTINPHTYTRLQIAEFLGWTIGRERNNAKQLDFRCKVAFHCLEAVERGLAKPTDFDLID